MGRYSDGDFSDGSVNSADLQALEAEFGDESTSALPEEHGGSLSCTVQQVFMTNPGTANLAIDAAKAAADKTVAEKAAAEKADATKSMPPLAPVQQQHEIQVGDTGAGTSNKDLPPPPSTDGKADDPLQTPANRAYLGDLLTTPITLDNLRDVNELEAKRKALAEEAQYLEHHRKLLDCDVTRVEHLSSDYKRLAKPLVQYVQDPSNRRTLFASASKRAAKVTETDKFYYDKEGNMVFSTPIQNVAIAIETLKTNRSPEAVAQATVLCEKAMKQQEIAISGEKLISKSEFCRSSVGNHNRRSPQTPS